MNKFTVYFSIIGLVYYGLNKFKKDIMRSKIRVLFTKETLNILPIYKFSGEETENCTICLEEYYKDEELRKLPCNHYFHILCIDRWITNYSTSCPNCNNYANIIAV